ncbi:hypothetical protein HX021_03085 [Sphingobacterium sp. N143]|uniref:hypothetical protein n=1 Tax=Sphingobacterium sp. N143 TaxID=2746727 RepID=UPI0025761A76|nr:hypothetical protein [Sphingobacterium sp. N143]MDM1293275.1 hypothetical protein [Sphingobacterium sp. N143]
MMKLLYFLSFVATFFVSETTEGTEVLDTEHSNEWYTEIGIWLFILLFIVVMVIIILRRISKKK